MLAFFKLGKTLMGLFGMDGFRLVALLVFSLISAIYTGHKTQVLVTSLADSEKKNAELNQQNSQLTAGRDVLIQQRDNAEARYRTLNDRNTQTALKMENTNREVTALKQIISRLQSGDSGANAVIKPAVAGMHNETVRKFNDKYGAKTPASAAR